MTHTMRLTVLGTYHVRRADATAPRAVATIVRLLEAGVTLVDVSLHDRFADVVTLRADVKEVSSVYDP